MSHRLIAISAVFLLALAGFAYSSFVGVSPASADQPAVAYSTTTPAPGQQVTATLAGSPTVSDHQWQWSSNAISWGNAGETGATTTAITVPDKTGFHFRYTWVRNGVREYATTHVTVTDETVTYATSTPAPGQQVKATLSGGTSGVTYQWQWGYDGSSWGDAGETGYNTDTFTVPNKPGLKFRVTWTRNGVWSGASSYVTVTEETASYSTTTPAPGQQVTATLSGGTSGVTYQWQWGFDGNSWGDAGETGYNTDTFTVPNKPGLKFRVTWTRNGVWSGASSHVTVTSSTVTYSTTTPLPGTAVAATVSPSVGLTYRWQWSTDGRRWGGAGESGARTDTLTVPNKPGFKFRLSWARNGVWESAASYVTVRRSLPPAVTVTYSTTTPDPGSQVKATLSNTSGVSSYRWQWAPPGTSRGWGNAGEAGAYTDTITLPHKPGFRFRLSWVQDGVRRHASAITIVHPPAPTVSYSTTTPVPGSQVLATLTGNTTGITRYQWQWSRDGSAWTNVSFATGKTTDTLTTPNSPGVRFRFGWTRYGAQEYAATHVTVTRSTVSYSTTTPAPGAWVTVTVTPDTGLTYQWMASDDGQFWGNDTGPGNKTKTFRVSYNPGRKFLASWTRNGIREYASSHVTVAGN